MLLEALQQHPCEKTPPGDTHRRPPGPHQAARIGARGDFLQRQATKVVFSRRFVEHEAGLLRRAGGQADEPVTHDVVSVITHDEEALALSTIASADRTAGWSYGSRDWRRGGGGIGELGHYPARLTVGFHQYCSSSGHRSLTLARLG